MTYIVPQNAPPWLPLAAQEIGFHETGDNRGIEKYIALAKGGLVGQPWCAIFANAMLEKAGIRGTQSPSSQSFRHSPLFFELSGPAIGALAVFWRTSKMSGLGHVGFYVGSGPHKDVLYILGGNEHDRVEIEPLPVHANTFGLVGFYWPTHCAIAPHFGEVAMGGGSVSTKVT